jgi:molybdopterin molybdotransferase
VEHGGRVPDTREQTEQLFAAALAADLVVSSGGVSVGPRDHVKPALAALGVEELFWRVAIQPGKPAWAGRAPTGAIVLGLPGNPLSALVGLHLLVAPLVRTLLGEEEPAALELPLAAPVRRLGRRLRALPAQLEGGRVHPLADASHQIARAAAADGLVLVEAGEGEVPAGTAVPFVAL